MKIETISGKIYREDKFNDPYYRMFLSNTCLRESCYQCPSRGLKQRADITLSDLWGAENMAPDLVDGKGLSLVLLHTDKGQRAFHEIMDKCKGREVKFDEAIKGNVAFFSSYERPALRDSISTDIDRLGFEKLVEKYTYTPKDKIKQILKKLRVFDLIKKMLGRS